MLNDMDLELNSRDTCTVDPCQAGRETLTAAGASAEKPVGWLGKVPCPTSTIANSTKCAIYSRRTQIGPSQSKAK